MVGVVGMMSGNNIIFFDVIIVFDYKIIYKCQKCGEIHKNILHKDDDFTKIVELSVIK